MEHRHSHCAHCQAPVEGRRHFRLERVNYGTPWHVHFCSYLCLAAWVPKAGVELVRNIFGTLTGR